MEMFKLKKNKKKTQGNTKLEPIVEEKSVIKENNGPIEKVE